MKRELCKPSSKIILLVFLASVIFTTESRPRYIECGSTLECGLAYCCVLGNGRYSLPRCVPLGKMNDPCRPAQVPLNVTVNYPDGENVELSQIYSTVCPCQAGLHCSETSGICLDQLEDLLLNTI